MHAVTLEQLEEISRTIAMKIVQSAGVDVSSVALDMTNFATFIDTGNGKAPVAQRGKAKQKRSDLRLVGLGLVVTRDGGIPLTWHAYPGNKPDVTQFPAMIGQLRGRCDHSARGGRDDPAGRARRLTRPQQMKAHFGVQFPQAIVPVSAASDAWSLSD